MDNKELLDGIGQRPDAVATDASGRWSIIALLKRLLTVGIPITTGDIEIGAVELKDGTTDNRAAINTAGAVKTFETTTAVEDSFQTSATGATFVQLASHACTALQIYNGSGAQIEVRRGAVTTKYIQAFDGYATLIDGIANSNELYVRRTDQSNTQLTIIYSYLV